MQSSNQIINSALRNYKVEIVGSQGSWQRSFIAASSLKSAKYIAREEKKRFLKNRANKVAKTIVKRHYNEKI